MIDALLASELGTTRQDASNRFSLDGVTLRPEPDGTLAIGIQKLETTSLRLTSGPFVIDVGRIALRELVGKLRMDGPTPRLASLTAASAEISGVRMEGPLVVTRVQRKPAHASHVQSAPATSAGGASASEPAAWHLTPLQAAEGKIRAEIIDAHLVFDADVTVPIRGGTIDFNEATVEHVGPDSRVGVSRLGIYVDAPNGRSYVFQFPVAPVAGVEFEQRRVLGAWVANRGKLQLQAFAEGLLRQAWHGSGARFTDETRELFQRTSISGDVRLSDGRFTAPGLEADLVGRTEGRNAIRLHSKAVGRGLTAELPSLSVRNAVLNSSTARLSAGELTGTLALRVTMEDKQLRFAFDAVEVKLSDLRLDVGQPTNA